jgi:S-(hydroxymethyl)glutathione dehydrogenase/alcohol dehydrogenase
MPAEGVSAGYDPLDVTDQGKRIVGCKYGSVVPAIDFPRLGRLYLAGILPLDALVGRRVGLDQLHRAFDDMRDGVGLRTVLEID